MGAVDMDHALAIINARASAMTIGEWGCPTTAVTALIAFAPLSWPGLMHLISRANVTDMLSALERDFAIVTLVSASALLVMRGRVANGLLARMIAPDMERASILKS